MASTRSSCLSIAALAVAAAVLGVHAEIVVTMDRYACVVEPASQTPVTVDMYGDMANTGTSSVTVSCRLTANQPPEWLPPGVCVGVACFPSDSDFDVELGPAVQDEIHLTFYPYEVAGKGVYWFRFAGPAGPDSVRLEVLSGVGSLVVDDDGGESSEWFVERAIPQNRTFLTWDQGLEPLALSDIAYLDRLVWITGGAPAGCISQEEVDLLTAFLEGGGKLLLSGQNALDGDAGATFGQEELGATVQSASVESRQIQGAAGTSFQVVAFDIEGGDGANNQTAPDALEATGVAFRALRYGTGEVAAVARSGLAGRRSLACGFGLEACADSTVLQESLNFLLDWLDNLVSGDDAPVAKPALVQIGPNPASGVLTVSLAIADGDPVRIWLTDLWGRHVGDLYQGAWVSTPLWLPHLAQGTYLLRVESPKFHDSQPLVVLEETR